MIYLHSSYVASFTRQTMTFWQLGEIAQSPAILGTEENFNAQTLFYPDSPASVETEEDNEWFGLQRRKRMTS